METSSRPEQTMITVSCADNNLDAVDSESVYSCIHKSLATLFPPSQATSRTVLCQVVSVVNSCYRGDALQYLLHFLFPAKQLLETLQQEACEQRSASLPSCWPLCLHERLVVQLCPLDHRLLCSGDFYLLVSPLTPPGSCSAPCRRNGARLLLCSVLASGRHVEQQEVPAVALPSLFSMAWLDSVNREREQRGVPPLQRCAVSTQRDVFTLPWEDLVYPQCTSRPRAASKEEVKTGTCPTAKPPPSLKTDQSAASDENDSEGEYVELTDQPLLRLSPQKGSLTQSISQLFRTRTPADTERHAQNSEHNATQRAAFNTPTQPTTHCTPTQPATHCTTTQPATHCTTTQQNTTTQPATQSTTTQTAANNSTHAAAHNTTNNTHLSEHETTHSIERPTDYFTTPTTQPTAHNFTQSAACNTTPNTTQSSEHNTAYNKTHPADLKVLHSWRQPTDHDTTHTTTQPPAHNTHTLSTECNSAQPAAQPDANTPECTNARLDKSQSENLMHLSVQSSLVEEHSPAVIHSTACSSTPPEEESLFCEKQVGGNGLMNGCSTDHREEQDQEKERSLKSLCLMEDDLKKEQQHYQQASQGCEKQESKSREEEGEDVSEEVNGSEGSEEVEVEEEVQVTIVPLRQEVYEKESSTEGGEDLKDSYSETTKQFKHMQDSFSNTKQNISSETTIICKTVQDSYSEDYSENTNSELPYFEIKLEKDTEDSENGGEFHLVSGICSESDTQPTYTQISICEENEAACETKPQPPVTDSSEKDKTLSDFCSEDTMEHKLCKYSENNAQSSQTETHHEDSLENACSYFENTALAQPGDPYCKNGPLQGSITPPTVTVENKQKTHGCEEAGQEGEGAKHQDKGFHIQPEDNVSAGPSVTVAPDQLSESSQSRFYRMLLRSGAVCLPGVRDRVGRPLLTVCSDSSVWSHPLCNSSQLLHLLLYYTSTLGTEARTSELTVLVDARRAAPSSTLFSALRALQEDSATSIHSLLILTNKESTLRLDKPAATQVEVLTSVRSLQKHVELKQLPVDFGGTFSFSQSSWIGFRRRVDQLTNQCKGVIDLLQKAIEALQNSALPAAAQDANQFLVKNKALMQDVLEDGRLVRLQQEGGALLSRLRKEEGGGDAAEEQRAAVETVSALYEEVDELLHRLVMLSNARTQELGFIVDFKKLEEGFGQVSAWMQEVGEASLQTLNEPEDSLERLVTKQQTFKEFYSNAYDHCKHGEELLSRMDQWSSVPSANLSAYTVKVNMFWSQLHDFSRRVHRTGHNLDRVVELYRFLDQAYGWALAGMRFLSTVSMEDCTLSDKCQAVIGCLEDYQRQHPPISDTRFQEMKMTAGELRGEQGLRHWSFAWSKCQEAKRMLDRKMEAALRTRDATHRTRSDSSSNRKTMPFRRTLSELWGIQESPSSSSLKDGGTALSRCTSTVATSISTPSTPGLPQHHHRSLSNESSDRLDVLGSSPGLSTSSLASNRRQQLRKTQSLDCPSTSDVSRYSPSSRALSEPVRTGNTGVFIKGLEVSSTEAADRTLFHRTPTHNWGGHCPSPRTPGTPRASSSPAAELRPRGSKLRHIVQEMVTTEREYVRSLSYIMDQYFPEMERADLPQDLRGKRSVVFGNLEKLLDFHSQFFLKELESCWRHPLRVSHCFLRHQEQFSLYALYSKNKPKSDALLANHGHSFFRRKQVQLGDKMDLSSYLLKPVQRMSKYALLLSDLMKEVGPAQEGELVSLQAATNMVKFQLRHGNDLLAMDAIRDCDVNLKEQGQLIRQEEFTVCSGRRKCQRRIFLFDELILFSKPKKVDGSLDIFTYKHSFKTADVGLTESTGDSGLQFEIWFRRRTSRNQTFILQASTAEVRQAWTTDIARILWTQATKNKEMRLKEMVSMGVGNKPFLDIQPSDAAISDRAVHYIMKSRGARTRASIAVSVLDHINPFKRGVVTADSAVSAPSSSSLLGPLNLHMFSQSQSSPPPPAEASFSSCIEEDEQEHETSSQPSMTTESSGSSSHCLSGSTGSDSGCVSSHLQEALPEETNKQRLDSNFISAEATPALSPATVV